MEEEGEEADQIPFPIIDGQKQSMWRRPPSFFEGKGQPKGKSQLIKEYLCSSKKFTSFEYQLLATISYNQNSKLPPLYVLLAMRN
jgi:hypothetical protein